MVETFYREVIGAFCGQLECFGLPKNFIDPLTPLTLHTCQLWRIYPHTIMLTPNHASAQSCSRTNAQSHNRTRFNTLHLPILVLFTHLHSRALYPLALTRSRKCYLLRLSHLAATCCCTRWRPFHRLTHLFRPFSGGRVVVPVGDGASSSAPPRDPDDYR